jgi:predicted nucleic acid-binding protein
VDASVVAKWALPDEEHLEKALKVKNDHVSGVTSLSAPTFLSLEITNAIWRAIKLKRLSNESAQISFKMLDAIGIDLYPVDWAEAMEVLNIAHQYDIAVYDAAYVYLSKRLNAPLITSDNRLIQKVKPHFEVIDLKDYV